MINVAWDRALLLTFAIPKHSGHSACGVKQKGDDAPCAYHKAPCIRTGNIIVCPHPVSPKNTRNQSADLKNSVDEKQPFSKAQNQINAHYEQDKSVEPKSQNLLPSSALLQSILGAPEGSRIFFVCTRPCAVPKGGAVVILLASPFVDFDLIRGLGRRIWHGIMR